MRPPRVKYVLLVLVLASDYYAGLFARRCRGNYLTKNIRTEWFWLHKLLYRLLRLHRLHLRFPTVRTRKCAPMVCWGGANAPPKDPPASFLGLPDSTRNGYLKAMLPNNQSIGKLAG